MANLRIELNHVAKSRGWRTLGITVSTVEEALYDLLIQSKKSHASAQNSLRNLKSIIQLELSNVTVSKSDFFEQLIEDAFYLFAYSKLINKEYARKLRTMKRSFSKNNKTSAEVDLIHSLIEIHMQTKPKNRSRDRRFADAVAVYDQISAALGLPETEALERLEKADRAYRKRRTLVTKDDDSEHYLTVFEDRSETTPTRNISLKIR